MAFKRVIIRRVGPLSWLLGLMTGFTELSEEARFTMLLAAREELRADTIAVAFRNIVRRFNLQRLDLGPLLSELFDDVSTTDILAIWKLDLGEPGRCLPDERVNELLSHLTIRSNN